MVLAREPKVLVEVCPVCGKPAPSEHHIKPRSIGGSDESINKVWLCLSCHDIIEAIYDETGMEYCSSMVKALQRRLGLHPGSNRGKSLSKREYMREYYKNNKERLLIYMNEYYRNNREHVNKYQRERCWKENEELAVYYEQQLTEIKSIRSMLSISVS